MDTHTLKDLRQKAVQFESELKAWLAQGAHLNRRMKELVSDLDSAMDADATKSANTDSGRFPPLPLGTVATDEEVERLIAEVRGMNDFEGEVVPFIRRTYPMLRESTGGTAGWALIRNAISDKFNVSKQSLAGYSAQAARRAAAA